MVPKWYTNHGREAELMLSLTMRNEQNLAPEEHGPPKHTKAVLCHASGKSKHIYLSAGVGIASLVRHPNLHLHHLQHPQSLSVISEQNKMNQPLPVAT